MYKMLFSAGLRVTVLSLWRRIELKKCVLNVCLLRESVEYRGVGSNCK